ncbi:hypothetical protein RAC87_23475, partial [Salmonella sp. 2019-SM265]|uniref:hypothetical protein n=1 Tax=Salmonella sp. 2019-SM265 TaxID=3068195 RepID=UPI0037523C92
DLARFHSDFFRAGDFVIGASGGFDRTYFAGRIKKMLGKLPAGSAGRVEGDAPSWRAGKTLLLLDKPGRTQAQIY